MNYLTDEQRQFDDLIKQINEDAVYFKKPETTFKRVLEFNNRSDSAILMNTDNRIITFGNTNQGFTILGADYVIDRQEFNEYLEMFNQFYQKEKAAAEKFINYLDSLELPVAPEILPPEPEEFLEVKIEIEPYSQAWLQDPENANWELHWNNGFEPNHTQYISQDLYHTHQGEFISHEYRAIDGHEILQRNLSIEMVKSFVFDRVADPENALIQMGIEVDQASLSQELPEPVLPQEQLLHKIEQEYESFKDGMKQHSKEEMMNPENTYEIMVKTEIVHHMQGGYISDELVDSLLESENLLDDIYQVYTENDSNQFFDPIQAAVSNYMSQRLNEEPVIASEVPERDGRMDRATPESPNSYTYNIADKIELEGHELEEAKKRSFIDDVIGVNEQEVVTENTRHEEIDLGGEYVEVQEESDGYLPVDELDADGVGNMKKHKARTNLKDFGYKGLE